MSTLTLMQVGGVGCVGAGVGDDRATSLPWPLVSLLRSSPIPDVQVLGTAGSATIDCSGWSAWGG